MAGRVAPFIDNTGLVFAYDQANIVRSYIGAPTTNICTGADYSIYNSGATNSRNQTFPLPPVVGYEVVRVVADTPGTYGQSILWTATYSSTPTTTTNSVYAWLASGTYVQVGQHWHPWNYGSPKYIEKGKWVRISETYAINEGGSYSQAAMVYSTDGVAYFCMPQYELKPYLTPFVGFSQTRSATQGLKDLTGRSTIDLTNVSFDSNAQMTFDGTDDYVEMSSFNVDQNNEFTLEAIIYPNTVSGNQSIIKKNTSNDNWPIFSLTLIGSNLHGYYSSPTYGQCLEGAYGTSSIITANKFWHVAYSKGVGGYTTMKLYINGVSVPYTDFLYGSHINSIATSTKPIHIGRNLDGASWIQPFNGIIPVSRVYNRQLTDSEIQQNFNAIKGRYGL